MSVRVMSAVFGATLDRVEGVGAPTAKLVLLALADHAADDGSGAYPSLALLQRKTALSRRAVINALNALVACGYIAREGYSRAGTVRYCLQTDVIQGVHDVHGGGCRRCTGGVQEMHGGGAGDAPESSFNHQLTEEEKEGEEGVPAASQDNRRVFQAYESNIGPLTPLISDELKDMIADHSPQWVIAAIREAALSGARSVRYVAAVLRRWQRDGYGTPKPENIKLKVSKSAPSSRPPNKPQKKLTNADLKRAQALAAAQKEAENA